MGMALPMAHSAIGGERGTTKWAVITKYLPLSYVKNR